MNKFILTLITLLLSIPILDAQIDISVARTMAEGEIVTVEGIATNGPELGIIRYVQDATAGIAVYPGSGSTGDFPADVSRGDLVTVTGPLKFFNGLLEIDPIQSYTVVSSNNPLPAAQSVSPDNLGTVEGSIAIVEDVTFDLAGGTFSVGNYTFTENGGGESGEIYVRSGSSFIGTPITQAAVNLTGIASQFNGNYQLLLRDDNDLEIIDDFYITEQPKQSDLTTGGFTVSWSTNAAASSNVRYGTTPAMTNEITNSNSTTDHTITVDGLDAAEFYYVQAFSNNGNTTVNSSVKLFSTASNSSGQVKVYFNHGVNEDFSNGALASNTTGAAIEAAIINRINSATTSIDCSIYNINRTTIVAALTEAYNNGITVRYIADDETANLALQNPVPPFPVYKGNAGNPLMHNKFFVFDAESDNDSYVIMGSTNMTDNNIADDPNNLVIIQDKAIAKAYTWEFNEMWGTDGPDPGIFNVKFGEDKTDNTPHLFSVNGKLVESYFSPSDNTALGIIDAVESADEDLQFALLTFTYNELGTAVLNEHNAGTAVRGIINNVNDTGTEFAFLQGQGVDVTDDNSPRQTHHKYCIIDATAPNSDPIVVTGSHNWSAGADVRNDENTLIFHNENIANIFLQEFEARWCEAQGGANCIQVSTEELNEIAGFEAKLFPNPATDHSNITMSLEESADVVISLWDFNGRMLQSHIVPNVQGEQTESLLLNGLATGSYIVTFKVGENVAVRQLQIVK